MRLRYLFPVFVWSLIILSLISIPGSSFPKTPFINIPHFDKLIHAGIFTMFTLLLNYGLFKQKSVIIVEFHNTISLVTGVIYSVTTEWIQMRFIGGRSGEIADLAADVVGCFAGIFVFYYLKKKFPSFLHKY